MKAFTLIELLVVVAIIGILSAIGIIELTGDRGEFRVAVSESLESGTYGGWVRPGGMVLVGESGPEHVA